ncbi:MAG TPA: AAA family ATPase [Longimicrobium sp.]|jgi:uncharacterized protein (TIGR02646 family)
MIYVDRSSVPRPASLASDHMAWVTAEAERFFEGRKKQAREQHRFLFDPEVWNAPDVSAAVAELFRGKCAYCETAVTSRDTGGVDHFRPRANARDDFRSAVDPDHYWWLAYEWTNLYLACAVCARNRGTHFPTIGPRAGRRSTEPEAPLLLDPCADNPQLFLSFSRDGSVAARDLAETPGTSRAATTIEVLGLNRGDLVRARKETAALTMAELQKLERKGSARTRLAVMSHAFRSTVVELLRPELRYAAVRWSVVERWMQERGFPRRDFFSLLGLARVPLASMPDIEAWPWEEHLAVQWAAARARVVPTEADPAEVWAAAAALATAPRGDKAARRRRDPLRSTSVVRVVISNFRAIRCLDLTLGAPPGTAQSPPAAGAAPADTASDAEPLGPWTVLLGENGVGKSTVVEAITLALAGEEVAAGHLGPPDELLHQPGEGRERPTRGYVRVYLTTDRRPLGFTFTRDRVTWFRQGAGAGAYLRAYGSTRLLPRPSMRRRVPTGPQRIDNLFDAFEPLQRADQWLARLKPERFGPAALALKDLLRISGEATLTRAPDGTVMIPDPGNVPRPLRHLSDGYQTVVALAVDIMAGMAHESDFSSTPGIVVLDELGTHLHPRWRMEIVGSLRRAFRKMQFIATTHEPLCLRGLKQGEIVVMRRENGGAVGAATDLPSPEGMRVDQLLTSPFFGLYTTIDPEVDTKFQAYYDLLATPVRTEDEEARVAALRAELSGYTFLGHTRRDQLVLDVVDRFLAEERKKQVQAVRLPQPVRDEITRIWKSVGTLGGVAP